MPVRSRRDGASRVKVMTRALILSGDGARSTFRIEIARLIKAVSSIFLGLISATAHAQDFDPKDLEKFAETKECARCRLSKADLTPHLGEPQSSLLKLLELTPSGIDLSGAELISADLHHGNLVAADLTNANLWQANLANADLRNAKLQGATLIEANFHGANLLNAALHGASFRKADLSSAVLDLSSLSGVDLTGADLSDARLFVIVSDNLRKATLRAANFSRVNLVGIDLSNANLSQVDFTGANLTDSDLSGARLLESDLTGVNFRRAKLVGARYEPVASPRADTMSQVEGLASLWWKDSPQGLIQLRESFKKAGMRQQEREVTYAIKHRERLNTGGVEGAFSLVLFELPSDYGMAPGRPLWIIGVLIFVFCVPYLFALRPMGSAGIWRVWADDRVRKEAPGEKRPPELLDGSGSAQPDGAALQVRHKIPPWRIPLIALQFSILSAFHIGWRDLNIGNWITRLQPREYTLRATGWVRTVSGIQSLISVYLIAMWAMVYFGRPFE